MNDPEARTISAHIHCYGKPTVEFTDRNLFLRTDTGRCVISADPAELEELAHQILDAVRGAQ